MKRYVSIWFPYLKTDWFSIRQPRLRTIPFVLVIPDHGRKVITAANELATQQSIYPGMVAADAKAIFPSLEVIDDQPGLSQRLLKRMAEWCIRFSPCVAVDGEDGLILDATGCTHLWGGDEAYLNDISKKFGMRGYRILDSIADTIGAAWAVARYARSFGGKENPIAIGFIVEPGQQSTALLSLPAAALRLDEETVDRLNKLGLRQVRDFIGIPKAALRRRFTSPKVGKSGSREDENSVSSNLSRYRSGLSDFRTSGLPDRSSGLLNRINQALGTEEEFIQPVHEPSPYEERLPCLEPIVTATGIEIALQRLLESLCDRLRKEGKGIRTGTLKCYRVDGKIETIEIGTIRASHHVQHLFRLFELKIASIEPGLGIELFILEAKKVEEHSSLQEALWEHGLHGLTDERISELLDRLSCKIGNNVIRRYLPAEHYWPERSVKAASSLDEEATTTWKVERPRPLQILARPEPIVVTAPIPDYPPMNFRYKGKLHTIKKADGPERIEQEWWIEEGQHRDYYYVEDEEGCRYWLFRLGHYDDSSYKWFVHGYFV